MQDEDYENKKVYSNRFSSFSGATRINKRSVKLQLYTGTQNYNNCVICKHNIYNWAQYLHLQANLNINTRNNKGR